MKTPPSLSLCLPHAHLIFLVMTVKESSVAFRVVEFEPSEGKNKIEFLPESWIIMKTKQYKFIQSQVEARS